MDYFEKVEKLVERAGVSFEEAKQALDESNGDMLDAMILLERSGKTKGPKNSTYSTKYEDQSAYYAASEQMEQDKQSAGKTFGDKVVAAGKKVWHVLSHNYLNVKRGEEPVVQLPLWAVVVILLSAWYLVWIILIVSLFFDVRYSFSGEADLKTVNDIMDKAANVAEKTKEEFKEN